MGGRILYFGADENHRLDILREAGYAVHSCDSLRRFQWILSSGARADAVAFAEAVGETPRAAISLARSEQPSPLILFQGDLPHYDESQFNLVVSLRSSPQQWLDDIAWLIADTRRTVRSSAQLRAQARRLRTEAKEIAARTALEISRSREQMEQSRSFKAGSLNLPTAPVDFGLLARSSSFLRTLEGDALQELRSLVRHSSCAAGTVLFAQGQPAREIYLLFAGSVKLAASASSGRSFLVRIAKAGDLLGLSAVLTASPHRFTAEACHHCQLGAVSSTDFLEFLVRHPRANGAAARELGRANEQAWARLQTMGLNSTVLGKLAGLLLEWSASEKLRESSNQIHLPLTQEEIGQCIGATRESVTRALHHLQQRRIITRNGSMLVVLDPPALGRLNGGR